MAKAVSRFVALSTMSSSSFARSHPLPKAATTATAAVENDDNHLFVSIERSPAEAETEAEAEAEAETEAETETEATEAEAQKAQAEAEAEAEELTSAEIDRSERQRNIPTDFTDEGNTSVVRISREASERVC